MWQILSDCTWIWLSRFMTSLLQDTLWEYNHQWNDLCRAHSLCNDSGFILWSCSFPSTGSWLWINKAVLLNNPLQDNWTVQTASHCGAHFLSDTLLIFLWTKLLSTRMSSGILPSSAKPGGRPRSSLRRGEWFLVFPI